MNDRAKGGTSLALAAIAALATACGGGAATDPGAETRAQATTGAEEEELPRCRVPSPPAEDAFERGERLAADGDAAGAAAEFDAACEAGNACGCSELGFAIATGEEPDAERGGALLRRGCEGGDAWGCYLLGDVLFRVMRGAEEARDAYAAACEGEVGQACFNLGRMSMSGVGGPREPEIAVQRYRVACDLGVVSACRALGESYALGVGLDADAAQARELVTWGCRTAEDPQSCRSFALLWPDDPGAAAALAQACEAGDRVACDARLESPEGREGAISALGAGATEGVPTLAVVDGAAAADIALAADVEVESLGLRPSCVGLVGRAPSARLSLPSAGDLTVRMSSDAADSVVVVHGPGGWHCGDDTPTGSFHPTVRIPGAPAGTYEVWAGGFDPVAAGAPARLEVALAPPTEAATATE